MCKRHVCLMVSVCSIIDEKQKEKAWSAYVREKEVRNKVSQFFTVLHEDFCRMHRELRAIISYLHPADRILSICGYFQL